MEKETVTSEALQIYRERASVEEIKEDVQLIQQVMSAVMKSGEHYGKIPGCGPKPTLLKPGAEKISATFRLYPDPEILSEIDTEDEYTVTVKVRLVHGPSGIFCGSGIGACSSLEEKYGWREAVCKEEFDSTPESKRRIKYRVAYGKSSKDMQIKTNPKDKMNTILKMSKKRAFVDGILSATAASDLFTQDLEDMGDQVKQEKKQQEPKKKDPPADPDQEWKALMKLLKITGTALDSAVKFITEYAKEKEITIDTAKKRAAKNPEAFEKMFNEWIMKPTEKKEGEAEDAEATTGSGEVDKDRASFD